MSIRQSSNRTGFSLIELVVVVLILGIIAAVAAPRAFDTESEARQSSTKSSLKIIRQAIELHKARQGVYPPAATLSTALKPYIRGRFPKVLVGNKKNANVVPSTQSPITVPEANKAGWAYNEATGEFVINQTTYITW